MLLAATTILKGSPHCQHFSRFFFISNNFLKGKFCLINLNVLFYPHDLFRIHSNWISLYQLWPTSFEPLLTHLLPSLAETWVSFTHLDTTTPLSYGLIYSLHLTLSFIPHWHQLYLISILLFVSFFLKRNLVFFPTPNRPIWKVQQVIPSHIHIICSVSFFLKKAIQVILCCQNQMSWEFPNWVKNLPKSYSFVTYWPVSLSLISVASRPNPFLSPSPISMRLLSQFMFMNILI